MALELAKKARQAELLAQQERAQNNQVGQKNRTWFPAGTGVI
jgi:hypothetical protein